MPNYRFECDTCGCEVFVFYPVDDAPCERVCEGCGGRAPRQLPRRIHVNCDGARLDFVMEDQHGEPVRVETQRKLHTLLDARGLVRIASDEFTPNSSKRKKTIKELKAAAKLPSFGEHCEQVRQKMGLEWAREKGKKKRKVVG